MDTKGEARIHIGSSAPFQLSETRRWVNRGEVRRLRQAGAAAKGAGERPVRPAVGSGPDEAVQNNEMAYLYPKRSGKGGQHIP